MNPSFDLEAPDLFTTGALGAPGQRVFYLQGRESGRLVTLKTEKEQMSALAEYLDSLLARLPTRVPAAAGDFSLLEPLTAAWAVGSIGVGYDEDADRVVIVATELVEREESEEEEQEDEEGNGEEQEREAAPEAEPPKEDAATARFRITLAQAAAFVERARAIVRAGRPVCPACSAPIDPGGHVCPRSNGHVVRS
jgi:uncharacterized repeat protein (TIGR03847 family)